MSSKDDLNKGKEEFENCFINLIKLNHNLDITIEWKVDDFDSPTFAVKINNKKAILTIQDGDLEYFCEGSDEKFRNALLNRKEKELLEKYYKK